jgi:hypothetical protein
MNKKAQFYLLTIMIILIVFIGFVIVANNFRQEKNNYIKNLEDEIKIERRAVLDYISANNLSWDSTQTTFKNFSNEFIQRIDSDKEIFFIFGNSSLITLIGKKLVTTNASIDNGSGFQEITGTDIEENYALSSDPIIKLDEGEYLTSIETGQNIYYLIRYSSSGEVYVIKG